MTRPNKNYSDTPRKSSGAGQLPELHNLSDCTISVCKIFFPQATVNVYAVDPLATFSYAEECQLKQQSLELFWGENRLPGRPEPLITSPRQRGYRTTSKRRVLFADKKPSLVIDQQNYPPGTLQQSTLEPELHQTIYEIVFKLLGENGYHLLARSLNYCVVRGTYERCTVILNVHTINADVVRKIKQFSGVLKEKEARILSCFMYVDETRSDYYLESSRPEKGVALKKLFGPECLDITVNGIKLLYPATVFSQVNESILPQFTTVIRQLLQLTPELKLLDLYCGYGLLGLISAPHTGSIVGMDIEGPAIAAAARNAAHLFPDKSLKFTATAITAEAIRQKLPPPGKQEVILLDPPRNGAAPGVIEAIAERKPLRILHIFCGTDEIPRELRLWQAAGYFPKNIQPLDMFPGSINLETLILLEPSQK